MTLSVGTIPWYWTIGILYTFMANMDVLFCYGGCPTSWIYRCISDAFKFTSSAMIISLVGRLYLINHGNDKGFV
jgi:hypothetical protein